jgi:hypothetical protein
MNTILLHISKVKLDTPIHVVADFYKNSIAPIKSVLALTVGCKCYVPSGLGGVISVTCKSINAGVITLTHKEANEITHYRIELHAPVMEDKSFTLLYESLKSKVMNKEQRASLYVAELQGYMNILSYTQYNLTSIGRERAKQLGL